MITFFVFPPHFFFFFSDLTLASDTVMTRRKCSVVNAKQLLVCSRSESRGPGHSHGVFVGVVYTARLLSISQELEAMMSSRVTRNSVCIVGESKALSKPLPYETACPLSVANCDVATRRRVKPFRVAASAVGNGMIHEGAGGVQRLSGHQ